MALLEVIFIPFPILCIPTIDSLKWASVLSIICISVFVVISIILGIIQVFKGVVAPPLSHPQGLTYNWFPSNFLNLSTSVSVFFTCFCSHVNIPKMTSELRLPKSTRFPNKIKKMDRVNNIAFTACTVIYFLVGLCGYLAFGPETKGNLLSNFADMQVWYLNIVKVLYAIVALFSFPILSFAPLVSIDKTFFKQPRPAARRVEEAFVWSILCYLVAIAIPDLKVIFSLTGSLCGIALVFVWPSLFYIFINKREKAKEASSRIAIFKVSSKAITFAWILFYVGVVMAILMTALEVKKLFD